MNWRNGIDKIVLHEFTGNELPDLIERSDDELKESPVEEDNKPIWNGKYNALNFAIILNDLPEFQENWEDRFANLIVLGNCGFLYSACVHDRAEIARFLLENGSNPNIGRSDLTGSTPLHCATKNHNLELVKLLIDYGADVSTKDNAGQTSLQFSTKYEKEIVESYLCKNIKGAARIE